MKKLEEWQEEDDDDWSELPSIVRSQSNRDNIQELGQRLDNVMDYLQQSQGNGIRAREQINAISKRLERLESTVTTGSNAIITRVALLEQTDKAMYGLRDEDRKELKSLQSFSNLLESFPWGFKGFVCFVFLLVVMTTAVVDLFVQVNGISDAIQQQLIIKD